MVALLGRATVGVHNKPREDPVAHQHRTASQDEITNRLVKDITGDETTPDLATREAAIGGAPLPGTPPPHLDASELPANNGGDFVDQKRQDMQADSPAADLDI